MDDYDYEFEEFLARASGIALGYIYSYLVENNIGEIERILGKKLGNDPDNITDRDVDIFIDRLQQYYLDQWEFPTLQSVIDYLRSNGYSANPASLMEELGQALFEDYLDEHGFIPSSTSYSAYSA